MAQLQTSELTHTLHHRHRVETYSGDSFSGKKTWASDSNHFLWLADFIFLNTVSKYNFFLSPLLQTYTPNKQALGKEERDVSSEEKKTNPDKWTDG